jgi:exopolysaccharide biosynthesis polyprenyl glycosylphosphotransferase
MMGTMRAFLRRNWRLIIASTAMLVDASVILICFQISLLLRTPSAELDMLMGIHGRIFAVSAVVFLGLFVALGVYRTTAHSSFRRQAFVAGRAYVYGVAIVLLTVMIFEGYKSSRLLLSVFFTMFPIVYIVVWFMVRQVLSRLRMRGYGQWDTLAIGPLLQVNTLVHRLRRMPDLGYNVTAKVVTAGSGVGNELLHVDREEVESVLKSQRIEMIAFSTAELNGSFEMLEQLCAQNRIGMRVISPEADSLFTKTGLHDIAGISLFAPSRTKMTVLKSASKRLFDIAGSLFCLLLLSPVFLGVALALKLESRGPVLFKQKRSLADDDTPFDFLKFRSMYKDADAQKESLFDNNEADGPLFKMKEDPRVTRVGRFIRRYSIDELPQLINVLKGDMSLVGPRPLPAADFQFLKIDDGLGGYFRQRAQIKPGMTGLWQVSGRSDLGFREMILLDLYYIEHQSILFDFEILAQTLPVVIMGKGAY